MKKRNVLLMSAMFICFITSFTSCVDGDYYDLYDYDDLPQGVSINKRSKFGMDNSYYIPDELIHTTGCGYKSIGYVVGSAYSMDEIKAAMAHFNTNVEIYPHSCLAPAIMKLTGEIVQTKTENISSSDISVGDIICVPPLSYGGYSMTAGHCTVVTEKITNELFTIVKCYDGCEFDILCIERVVQTSML